MAYDPNPSPLPSLPLAGQLAQAPQVPARIVGISAGTAFKAGFFGFFGVFLAALLISVVLSALGLIVGILVAQAGS